MRGGDEKGRWLYLDFPGGGFDLHVEVVPSLLLRETREPVELRVSLEGGISRHGNRVLVPHSHLVQYIIITTIVVSIV